MWRYPNLESEFTYNLSKRRSLRSTKNLSPARNKKMRYRCLDGKKNVEWVFVGSIGNKLTLVKSMVTWWNNGQHMAIKPSKTISYARRFCCILLHIRRILASKVPNSLHQFTALNPASSYRVLESSHRWAEETTYICFFVSNSILDLVYLWRSYFEEEIRSLKELRDFYLPTGARSAFDHPK